MRRKLILASVAVAAALVPVGLASPAVAAPTNCTDNQLIQGTTVEGSLNVPAGFHCTVQNSVITGSVTVQPNAVLVVFDDSWVKGNFNATEAVVHVRQSRVSGSFLSNRPNHVGAPGEHITSLALCGSTFGGPVTVKSGFRSIYIGSDVCASFGEGPAGNTIVGNLSTLYNDTRPRGDFNQFIADNVIGGNLVCVGNQPPPLLGPLAGVGGANVVTGNSVGQCAPPVP